LEISFGSFHGQFFKKLLKIYRYQKMVKQATSKSNFKKTKKKKRKKRFGFSNETLKVLAYLLAHPDVTNCFVPPMVQPIKSKAPQLPNFPHYPTKPNNPILSTMDYLFIGQMWHPSSSICPIEPITTL